MPIWFRFSLTTRHRLLGRGLSPGKQQFEPEGTSLPVEEPVAVAVPPSLQAQLFTGLARTVIESHVAALELEVGVYGTLGQHPGAAHEHLVQDALAVRGIGQHAPHGRI